MTVIRLGLIGDNIAPSRAPTLHGLAGRLTGLEIRYDLLVPKDLGLGFDRLFDRCAGEGYRGVNVTYPYKQRAAARSRIDDPLVRAIAAVNTVVFDDVPPVGFNTDHSGFIAGYRETRKSALPGVVCLIGAGGAGRAVAFGLVSLGATEIRLVERDAALAEALAAALRAAAPDIAVAVSGDPAAAAAGAQGILNCSPVGMVGHAGTPLPKGSFAGASWAFDAVYTPLETRFLQDARAAGLTTISGFELFFHQGVKAFEVFTGERPDAAVLRAAVRKAWDAGSA